MAGEAEARAMSVDGEHISTDREQHKSGREGLPGKQGPLDSLRDNSRLCFLLLNGKSLTVTWVMALVFPT